MIEDSEPGSIPLEVTQGVSREVTPILVPATTPAQAEPAAVILEGPDAERGGVHHYTADEMIRMRGGKPVDTHINPPAPQTLDQLTGVHHLTGEEVLKNLRHGEDPMLAKYVPKDIPPSPFAARIIEPRPAEQPLGRVNESGPSVAKGQ